MDISRKDKAAKIFHAALRAADPYRSVAAYTNTVLSLYQQGGFSRLFLTGFGKAAPAMAKAVVDIVGADISKGVILTKYGHSPESGTISKVKVIEAGHPIPDESGLAGTREIIELLKNADEQTLVVCLISGGGSALLVAPCLDVSLADKQKVTGQLLKAGADIYELNTVRKHISMVKGGRLAEHAWPATIISLILSDVIGDRLDVIASGPTAPDSSTYGDALRVLEKYGLTAAAPYNVVSVLRRGSAGLLPETPKMGTHVFEQVENIIIGSNRQATMAAKQHAEKLGFETTVLSSSIQGEAREAARLLARRAREIRDATCGNRPCCLISGGETTVTVRGSGLGGRNMEFALAFALEIDGFPGITLLSAGTDGTDGPTDADGAVVDWQTIRQAGELGLNASEYLGNNDSYHFFQRLNSLFITGPTGTNVMDIQIVLIEDD